MNKNDNSGLDMPLEDIIKLMPDSGVLHEATFRNEVQLREDGLDMMMDHIPWSRDYKNARIYGFQAIARLLNKSVISSPDDIKMMTKFTPYVPDFGDMLI